MTQIIEAVQKHEVGGGLIRLYEITLPVSPSVLYFHSGLDQSLNEVQFDGNTYTAFPMEVTGMEFNADGAINRPELIVANVLSTFSDELNGLKYKDLIGERVTVRTTLSQHLGIGSSIEFPVKKYIIDRLSGETSTAVTFELAAPFDLTGIQIPNRQVLGKYCSWVYQGAENDIGGCMWRSDSSIEVGGTTRYPYFTVDDIPIIPSDQTMIIPYKTYTPYSGVTAYSVDDYVKESDTIWKCIRASTGNTPSTSPDFWVRGDVCGKKLFSCKARFQHVPDGTKPAVASGALDLNTNRPLPFGAFPGSKKFR